MFCKSPYIIICVQCFHVRFHKYVNFYLFVGSGGGFFSRCTLKNANLYFYSNSSQFLINGHYNTQYYKYYLYYKVIAATHDIRSYYREKKTITQQID